MTFELLRGEVMKGILNKHIAKYFDDSDTVDNAGEKLLSTNAFKNTVAAFIPRTTSKPVFTECIAMKMEKELNLQTLEADAKRFTGKSVSPPSCTDLAPSFSPSKRDNDAKTEKCRSRHRSRSRRLHRRHRKDKNRSSTSSRSDKSDESPSRSDSKTHPTQNCSRRGHQSKEDRPKVLCLVSNRFYKALDYHNYHHAINRLSMMNVWQKALQSRQKDYKYQ